MTPSKPTPAKLIERRYDDGFARMYVGDAIEVLSQMPEKSVHCCVTSPPYFGLRSYLPSGHPAKAKEGGTQETPEAYVEWLVEVFRSVWKVLRDDGTCWINLGDAYNSGASGGLGGSTLAGGEANQARSNRSGRKVLSNLKPKDLLMIPARVALALQADGWWLRQEIVWSKPSSMPESVSDRCTRSHEMLYMLTKKPRYFYDADAIREPLAAKTYTTFGTKHRPQGNNELLQVKSDNWGRTVQERKPKLNGDGSIAGANKRSVWTIASKPFAGSHYAVYPPELVTPCIKAGTSERGVCSECGAPWRRMVERSGETTQERARKNSHADHANAYPGAKQNLGFKGSHWKLPPRESHTVGWEPTCSHAGASVEPAIVLDPFSGSGTTGLVARKLGRRSVLIDLDERNVQLLEQRMGYQGVLL